MTKTSKHNCFTWVMTNYPTFCGGILAVEQVILGRLARAKLLILT